MTLSDPNSCANAAEVRVTRMQLDLTADFARRALKGHVVLELDLLSEEAHVLLLDTAHLAISGAFDASTGAALHFEVKTPGKFGACLEVKLPQLSISSSQKESKKLSVRIEYETTPSSSAVQWLEPSQTMGKKHPCLFTQSQAIHARSFMPCQDTPGAKVSYSATIRVPHELIALMSALPVSNHVDENINTAVFKFEQPVAVPTYLIALAIGKFKGSRVGPRSIVWSEEELADKCAYEFAETEKFLAAGERLLTPYIWKQYDILVIGSFPYGGMENPCLTFVTPTLLAGDRSLVSVIIHEIAHSWTGNLVTNENWEHFWLNEGYTVYVERLILRELYGEPTRHFHAIIGWKDLTESIEEFGSENPLTALVPNLKGVDPDDSFSSVPYEKGFNLLFHLENILGGLEVFLPWLQSYIRKFMHTTVNTEQWRQFLYDSFPQKRTELDAIDWNRWLNAPGMPPIQPVFDQTLAKQCSELSQRWIAASAGSGDYSSFHSDDIASLSSLQKVVFLDQLSEVEPMLPMHTLDALAKIYSLSSTVNAEIRLRWYTICLKAGWTNIFPNVVSFLSEQGRMKFIRPLYRSLNRCGEEGRALAQKTFAENRSFYHPIAVSLIEKDLAK